MQRLLIVLAIGAGLLLVSMAFQYRQPATPEQQGIATTPEPEADYYFIGALSRHYDDEGRFDYEFYARRVEHFVEADYTLVDAPAMTLYPDNSVPWKVTAQRGRSVAGNETVELWEDVQVNRESPSDPLQMRTEELTLQPAKKLASTDDPIVITSNRGRVDATGMNAFIETNRLELLSKVRVQHDPIKVN